MRKFSIGVLALATCASLIAPRPAAANGAASTRNIIFGSAAAIGGTLLIINHNKKVHQKYAEYDQRQATTESERNQAESAYQSERSAYAHEAALVTEYRRETAYQHAQVVARDREIASLRNSLVTAKYGSGAHVAAAQPAARTAPAAAPARPVVAQRSANGSPQVVSYGWGSY